MASKDGLEVRRLLTRGEVLQTGTDGPVAIRLKHKGFAAPTFLLGNSSTIYDITNPSGTTFTYTFAGVGLDPLIGSVVFVGTTLIINGGGFNVNNNGTFVVTAVTTNSFSITNAAGVAESGVALLNGYIITQAVLSVTVDNSANTLVLIDSLGTTFIQLDAPATSTIGAVVDVINDSKSWGAMVLDALRSDSIAGILMPGAVTLSTDEEHEPVYDLHVDTSIAKQFAICFTSSRGFGRTREAKYGHMVKLKLVQYLATMGTVAAGNVLIVERRGPTETVIYSGTSVSATNIKEIDLTGDDDSFISSDYEFVIIVKDPTGGGGGPNTGPTPPNLLTAQDFTIISETGITNTGSHTTLITGNIGSSPITAAAMDNVFCSEITGGSIYGVDAAYTGSGAVACFLGNPPLVNKTKIDTAVADMLTAYTDASAARPGTVVGLGAGTLNGNTLTPGTYKWSTAVNITGDITLSGGANDVWLFQIAGNLTLAAAGSLVLGTHILLTGGAQASNVFWQVGGGTGATLGTYATMNGTILSAKQVIIQTGAVLNGRAWAQTQVTLDANTVNGAGGGSGGGSIVDSPSNFLRVLGMVE